MQSIKDWKTNRYSQISFVNELRTAEQTRLVWPNFMGTTFDTNFWTSLAANNGTNTQTNWQIICATGTTANWTAGFNSVRSGRFMFSCPNYWRGALQFGDTWTTNNKRRFGAFNSTTGDGYFFQLNWTTFSIGYQKATSETLVNSWAFNLWIPWITGTWTWTVDTNIHFYEIFFFVARVEFYIDWILIHTLVPTTTTLSALLTLPCHVSNTNSWWSTTNVNLTCYNMSIVRLWKEHHSTITRNIVWNSTNVLKYWAWHIDNLFINSAVTWTITVYDNTAASWTLIATITTPNNSAIWSALTSINFQTWLTIVTSVAGHDVTVSYE